MSFGEQTDSNSETWRVRRLFHKELYYSSLQLKNPNISNTLTLIQIHAYGEKFIIKKWACYSWLPLKIKAFPRIWKQEKLLRLTSFLILVSVSLSIDHSRFPLFQDALIKCEVFFYDHVVINIEIRGNYHNKSFAPKLA